MTRKQSLSLIDRLTRGAPFAVLLLLSFLILYQLRSVLELIAIAILLSLIFQTLLHQLEKLVKKPWLAVLILSVAIIGLTIMFPLVIVPSLLDQVGKLSSQLPQYINNLTSESHNLHEQYQLVPDISQQISKLKNFIDGVIGSLPQMLAQAFGITIEVFATVVLALYITNDPKFLINGLLRFTPRRHHQRTKRILKNITSGLQGWMTGTLWAMLFLGVGTVIGLWILGIPLALSFGIIAGLLEVIPYIGSFAGGFLPALVALTISPVKLILVIVLFLILNQIDAHVIQPLVMGHQVNLHPIAVIMAILIMGELLGIIGVIFAIPAAVIIMKLLDEFTSQSNSPKPSLSKPPPSSVKK